MLDAQIMQILVNALRDLSEENGCIENLQALLIGVAFVTSSWMALTRSGAERTAAWVLACVCLLSFFREMDLRAVDVPTWVIMLTSGSIRKLWYAVPLVSVVGYVIKHREDLRAILPALPRMWLWPLYVSCLFGLLGQVLDQLPGPMPMGHFNEEAAELIGYVFLVVATTRFLRGGIIQKLSLEPVLPAVKSTWSGLSLLASPSVCDTGTCIDHRARRKSMGQPLKTR